ncbi:uncharacterized protein LOC135266776 [Tribolium castaneum]|uniref:uncharacterized protein LOC135266776 n=1 Tax=Tribolium castaneum TaxID=7070 RepID=UPI0030FEB74F
MDVVPRKKYCCKYPGCNNWYYINTPEGFVNKHFFVFPKDPTQHQQWRNICKISSKNSDFFRICEDHFDESAFVNERKDRLNFRAVPLVPTEPSDIHLLEDLPLPDQQSKIDEDPSSSALSEENVNVVGSLSVESPSTSSFVNLAYNELCSSSHSQSSEVINNSDSTISNSSCLENHNETSFNVNKLAFLDNQGRDGILTKIGCSSKDLTPRKELMYKAHRNIQSRLCRLSKTLEKEKGKVKTLQKLFDAGKFEFITENLNEVTKAFINSQLRNVFCQPTARRWTDEDKAFALSLYKRSPRLYKYLQVHFQLPSSRTLKAILAKIQFDTGINPGILEHLKNQVSKMKRADRYRSLLFDEMSVCQGFHYERAKQYISGYEDMGSLGRTNKAANHAVVFMIRGLRLQWKQVYAYYFTANTVSANNLKFLIEEIISQLQNIGLTVVATVCDQGTTNVSALNQLCAKQHPRQGSYYFFINNQPIVTIFDVPHLLKNTRNALLKCKIQFAPHKYAKFEHIESVFNFDQQKTFKSLPKLKKEYFNFKDSYMKMKVKVAAAQLSSSVAAAIETFVSFAHILPSEAIHTAEFVQKVDNMFDSLNGSNLECLGISHFDVLCHKIPLIWSSGRNC